MKLPSCNLDNLEKNKSLENLLYLDISIARRMVNSVRLEQWLEEMLEFLQKHHNEPLKHESEPRPEKTLVNMLDLLNAQDIKYNAAPALYPLPLPPLLASPHSQSSPALPS
jgi:hypothetical protein